MRMLQSSHRVIGLVVWCAACGALPDEASGVHGSQTAADNEVHRAALSPARTTLAVAPNNGVLLNPERGLYTFVDLMGGASLSGVRASGRTLVYTTVRLDDYLTTPIADSFLTHLTEALDTVRTAHLKVLLRFAYNSPGEAPNAANVSDASLAQIQLHLSQLAPVLEAASDIIVAVEAGLIGQYGEWHDSTQNLTNPNDRRAVVAALLAAVPVERTVLLRTPGAKRENCPAPVTAAQAFGASAVARLGHHNDCFLASTNDLDTYVAVDDGAYLATDTAYLPMAGETCAINPPRTDCSAALGDLQAYHWDMLNGDFHPDVLAGWAEQGCLTTIQAQLGYQLSLTALSMNLSTQAAQPLVSIRATITNSGFGRLFHARPVYLSLIGVQGRTDYLLDGIDPRQWGPQAQSALQLDVPLGQLASGTYAVALWLPDADSGLRPLADYAVQLANQGMWDAADGLNVLTRAFVVQ